MVLPTVYQGMYNIVTRDMEREIVPVAREFGLRLYMYNPLAAGILAGRYSNKEALEGSTEGRFSQEFGAAALYRSRYGKDPILESAEILRTACAAESQEMDAVALRWLIHHSLLAPGDGIIIGVSKESQLVRNLAAWQGGPLSPELVAACDNAWKVAKPVCESYFRGFGAQPGGIEKFLALKSSSGEVAQEEKP